VASGMVWGIASCSASLLPAFELLVAAASGQRPHVSPLPHMFVLFSMRRLILLHFCSAIVPLLMTGTSQAQQCGGFQGQQQRHPWF
jgi:hypothetical protein